MLLSIIFFVYTVFGLGLLVDLFLKWNASFYEKLVMRLGVGLAAFTLLGVFLDLLFVPLHFLVYIVIATVLYIYVFLKKKDVLGSFSLPKKELAYLIIVLALFAITAYMYIGGSFSYTYMENGDPWGYTTVSKTISEELTFKVPYKYGHYAEPYTQGYQVLMAILHQTNDSIYHTMKFFHNLIISLSILFFFFFAQELFKRRDDPQTAALIATVLFFAIPSWLSHFIFSLSFNMVLIPVLLYALLKVDEDKNWQWVAGIIFGSILINHFFTSVIIAVMLAFYFVIKTLVEKRLHEETITTLLTGFVLSLAFIIPTNIRHSSFLFNPVPNSHGGFEQILTPLFNNPLLLVAGLFIISGVSLAIYQQKHWFKKKYLAKNNPRNLFLALFSSIIVILLLPFELLTIRGSADRVYTFNDFFTASAQNMINNPVGWGYIITILAALGFILLILHLKSLFKKEYFDYLFILTFFLLFFLLVFGKSLSISIMPFRMWTFVAIFVCLLGAIALYAMYQNASNPIIGAIIIFLVLAAVIYTSFIPKYGLNNASWPDEQLVTPEIHSFYDNVRENFPHNTRMVSACRNSDFLVSYNMAPIIVDKDFNRAYGREQDLVLLHEQFYDLSVQELHEQLSTHDVEFVSVGLSCVIRDLVRNNIDQQTALQQLDIKVQEMVEAQEYFVLAAQSNTELLFRVR